MPRQGNARVRPDAADRADLFFAYGQIYSPIGAVMPKPTQVSIEKPVRGEPVYT